MFQEVEFSLYNLNFITDVVVSMETLFAAIYFCFAIGVERGM